MEERDLLNAVLKFSDIDEEVESLEGRSTGEKILNYILIKYFQMKNYKKYGLVRKLLDQSYWEYKTIERMVKGNHLRKENLTKLAIGCNLNFEDAVYLFWKYGYSLCEFSEDKFTTAIIKLKDRSFRKKHFIEKMEECGIY